MSTPTRPLRFFHLEVPDPNESHHLTQFETEALSVSLSFEGEEDLLDLTERLGVPLTQIPPGASLADISAWQRWEQPGWREIEGGPVFLWIERNRLRLSISGVSQNQTFYCDKRDYHLAQRLEERIAGCAERVVREVASRTRVIAPDERLERVARRRPRRT